MTDIPAERGAAAGGSGSSLEAVESLCRSYLAALEAGDLAQVLELFTPEATVVSPLYGTRPAAEFYPGLFADTQRSETTLVRILHSAGTPAAAGLHFRYRWTLSDGQTVAFECVDIFELDGTPPRFNKLTILYDTAPLRPEFVSLQSDRR